MAPIVAGTSEAASHEFGRAIRQSPIPRADFTYTNTQVSVWSTPASEGFEKLTVQAFLVPP